MKIEISKEAEEATKLLQEILDKVDKFKEISGGLEPDEFNLVGGIVLGVYSPTGKIGTQASIGNVVVCDGIVQRLVREKEETRG